MSYWTDEHGGCACGRSAKVIGEAQFAVGSTGPICELCVQEDGFVFLEDKGMYFPSDWCARTEGKRKGCPEEATYCGTSSGCREPDK